MRICKRYILCALFGLLAISQAGAQSIVGAWSANDVTKAGAFTAVLLANGTYYHIENVSASEAPHGFPGFERGTYTWNSGTGAFTVKTLQDLNGDVGLSDLNSLSGLNISVAGDTATFFITANETETLTRVTGASPIVGAWIYGDSSSANASAAVVFFPNGVYVLAEDGAAEPGGQDGIEHGTYSWNAATGAFTSSRSPAPYIDTNGQWGLSHPDGALTFTLSADGLTLTGATATDSFSLARVGGAAGPPVTAQVVEYFNASLDHYFVTWAAGEIATLDAGVTIKGWVRTGKMFKTYPTAQAGTTPVCRYYIPPGKGDSHFFGRGSVECDATGQKNPSFILEDPQFMQMFLPELGVCPTGTTAIYRAFSNRADANHRYMTDRAVRGEMMANGWLAEGDGPDLVVMCAPM